MELCNACKKPSTQRCSRCETSYCSQVPRSSVFAYLTLEVDLFISRNAKWRIGSKVDIGRSVRLSPDCTFGIAPIGETARNQVQVEYCRLRYSELHPHPTLQNYALHQFSMPRPKVEEPATLHLKPIIDYESILSKVANELERKFWRSRTFPIFG
jgi:hypothetical protein